MRVLTRHTGNLLKLASLSFPDALLAALAPSFPAIDLPARAAALLPVRRSGPERALDRGDPGRRLHATRRRPRHRPRRGRVTGGGFGRPSKGVHSARRRLARRRGAGEAPALRQISDRAGGCSQVRRHPAGSGRPALAAGGVAGVVAADEADVIAICHRRGERHAQRSAQAHRGAAPGDRDGMIRQ